MRIKQWYGFSLILAALVLTGCFKEEEYPVEPFISEPTFTNMTDSAVVSFTFTDGDGDVGLGDDELDPPYDSSSIFYYNLYLNYYEKDDINGWQQGIDLAGNPISFKYRIERIQVKGKQRGMKGTMDVALSDFQNPFSDQSDTIKFSIQLFDRALHESNIIETVEIVP